MKKKIACFGVRDYEIPFFQSLGEKYGYELDLNSPFLTNENHQLALGYEVIMVRANCFLNRDSITNLYNSGLRYLLTRTVGYNHIDLAACKDLGIESAFVPGYSPNAIAELAVTLSMMLLRNTAYMVSLTSQRDFRVTNQMFSKEIRNQTVGIIGCGRIGATTAKLFKGLGANVLGYDVYQSDFAKQYLDFVELDELLAKSDVISLHMPHIVGVNDEFINKDLISKMKDGVIVVNTARGELQNLSDLSEAVKSGKIAGLGIDVVANEKTLFFQKFDNKIENQIFEDLVSLYPRVLITPHVGSSTDEALSNMIETSLQNMDEYLETGKCKNTLIK